MPAMLTITKVKNNVNGGQFTIQLITFGCINVNMCQILTLDSQHTESCRCPGAGYALTCLCEAEHGLRNSAVSRVGFGE